MKLGKCWTKEILRLFLYRWSFLQNTWDEQCSFNHIHLKTCTMFLKLIWSESSRDLLWSPVIRFPSVNYSHFHVCLTNHWTNFKQNWNNAPFGKGVSSISKWRFTPFYKGSERKMHNTSTKLKKNSSLESLGQFETKFGTRHSCVKGGGSHIFITIYLILNKEIMILSLLIIVIFCANVLNDWNSFLGELFWPMDLLLIKQAIKMTVSK